MAGWLVGGIYASVQIRIALLSLKNLLALAVEGKCVDIGCLSFGSGWNLFADAYVDDQNYQHEDKQPSAEYVDPDRWNIQRVNFPAIVIFKGVASEARGANRARRAGRAPFRAFSSNCGVTFVVAQQRKAPGFHELSKIG